jgi:hypothetical protein
MVFQSEGYQTMKIVLVTRSAGLIGSESVRFFLSTWLHRVAPQLTVVSSERD